jgi:GDP-L-fucose synthase
MDKNMKVLVTGSNGLLGNALKELLGNDHIYHTRNDVDLLDERMTKEYITYHVKNSKIDTIIHCAAKVGGVQVNSNNNESFFIENYKINNNVIYSSFENNVKNFVNLSSTCIFPDVNITYPLTANQIDIAPPHSSNYGYSYAKRLSGYQTKIFRQLTGYNWITVVPTNVYGPHDNFHPDHSHIIPGIIHRAYNCNKNNEKFVVWGDGSPLRQFIHSKDLAKNIIWAINNWNSDIPFMAVNNNEYSVMDVVKIVTKKLDIKSNRLIFDETKPRGQFRKPAKSDIPENYEYIDLEQGINETIDWFIKNYNILRK